MANTPARRVFIADRPMNSGGHVKHTQNERLQNRSRGPSGTVVIIPALNEESSIGLVVRAIPRDLVSEIVVVDNGSTDGTGDAASEAEATVLLEPRRGYGRACMKGIEYAGAKGACVVVFLDGDSADDPGDLSAILQPIRVQGYELVIGSRMEGVREPGAIPLQGIVGNWLATLLIRVF